MSELTREAFKVLLMRDNEIGMHAVGRALVACKPIGFGRHDGDADAYSAINMLSKAQLEFWRAPLTEPRIWRFIPQLLNIARAKQQAKLPVIQQLKLAVADYWNMVDCDSAEMMAPYERAVRELAAKAGVDVRDALGGAFQTLAN